MDVLDFRLKPLRSYLSQDTYDEALKHSQRLTFKDGQALQMRGDKTKPLRIVVSGAVKFGRITHAGAFNLLIMIGPGTHFGVRPFFNRTNNTNNAYALGPTEIDVLDENTVNDLLVNEPSFARGIGCANEERVDLLSEMYDDIRTLSLTTHLAKVIWIHTGRGELANGVACLQSDFAELLGVTQAAIGKAIKRLQTAELIVPGYRCVHVPDKSRLESWLYDSGAL